MRKKGNKSSSNKGRSSKKSSRMSFYIISLLATEAMTASAAQIDVNAATAAVCTPRIEPGCEPGDRALRSAAGNYPRRDATTPPTPRRAGRDQWFPRPVKCDHHEWISADTRRILAAVEPRRQTEFHRRRGFACGDHYSP